MPRERSRSGSRDRDRRRDRRDRDRERERERRRRRDRHNHRDRSSSEEEEWRSSRRRSRTRSRSRSRDVTPVYDSRTGQPSAERGELLWDRERERLKKKEKEREMAAKLAMPSASNSINEQDIDGKSQDEIDMMKVMGFGNFDSTKNKKVKGNDVGDVHVLVKRKYRQYMNRKGGFNRPLDFVH